MAEKQRPANAEFIGRLTGEGTNPPETRFFSGWFGDSGKEGTRRLYLDPALSSSVDIPDDAILNTEPIRDSQPAGGVLVWVRADAQLSESGSATSRASQFFRGQLQQDLLGEGAESRGGYRCVTQVPCGEPTGFTGACTKQPVVGGAWPCITAIPHCAEPTGFTGKCTHVPWPNPTRYYGCTILHQPTLDLTCIPAICNAVASGLPGCGGGNPVEQGGGPQQAQAVKETVGAGATHLLGCGYTKTWGLCPTHLIGCTGYPGCGVSQQQPCITQTEIGPRCQHTIMEPNCFQQQPQACIALTQQPGPIDPRTPVINPANAANAFAQQQVGGIQPQPSLICATAIACNITLACAPTHFFCPPQTLLCRSVIECSAFCPIPTPWTIITTTPVQQPFPQQFAPQAQFAQQAQFAAPQPAGGDTLSPEICTTVNCTAIACPTFGFTCTALPPDCPPATMPEQGCPSPGPGCTSIGPACVTPFCQGGGGGGGAQQFGAPRTFAGCFTPFVQFCPPPPTQPVQCPSVFCSSLPVHCPRPSLEFRCPPSPLPFHCPPSLPPHCPPSPFCPSPIPFHCPSGIVCQPSPVPACAQRQPGFNPEVTQACGGGFPGGGQQQAAFGAPQSHVAICTQVGSCHPQTMAICFPPQTQHIVECVPNVTRDFRCVASPVPFCGGHIGPSAFDACPSFGPCFNQTFNVTPTPQQQQFRFAPQHFAAGGGFGAVNPQTGHFPCSLFCQQ